MARSPVKFETQRIGINLKTSDRPNNMGRAGTKSETATKPVCEGRGQLNLQPRLIFID